MSWLPIYDFGTTYKSLTSLFKKWGGGWRDGSEVKPMNCPCTEPYFVFQHSCQEIHNHLQLQVIWSSPSGLQRLQDTYIPMPHPHPPTHTHLKMYKTRKHGLQCHKVVVGRSVTTISFKQSTSKSSFPTQTTIHFYPFSFLSSKALILTTIKILRS